MCGRYTLANASVAQLRARFGLGEQVHVERRYNVAPGDEVLAVVERDGEHVGARLRWGLVPHWSADRADGLKLINARAETIATRPAFRTAFERDRCLIVADGFYEWQRLGDGPRTRKQPYWIARADGEPFAFAGLRATVSGPDGNALRTCAIVTTAANTVLRDVHDRMPAILSPDVEQTWLDAGATPSELLELLAPLPDAQTALRPIGDAVNDARYDGPACLEAPAPRAAGVAAGQLF